MRALPAGLLLAAIARQRPHGVWWLKATVLGVLNIGAFFALLFVAAYRLPGGVAATLGAVQPLVAAGLAATLLRERLRATVAIAGLIGIAGATSMATGAVLTKRWGRSASLIAFTSWQLIAGGLLLTPLALTVEGTPPDLTMRNLIGFTWLATGGTAVAYLLWFRGIARLPVSQVSLLALASPIVATLSGWIVLHQTLSGTQLFGGALVLTALWYGQRPSHPAAVLQRRRPTPTSKRCVPVPSQ